MLSREVVEFEERTAGMAVTGLCRCKGNAEGGWEDSRMTRKEAFWRQMWSWHRREVSVTVWRKAPFGIAPHQRGELFRGVGSISVRD